MELRDKKKAIERKVDERRAYGREVTVKRRGIRPADTPTGVKRS